MTSEIKNRKDARKPAQSGFKRAEFINHTFTKDDKARFKEWAQANAGELWSFIDKLLDEGFAISVKFDNFNECFAAYLQTSDEKDERFGYILTGRSKSGSMALLAVIFRHYGIFDGSWPLSQARRNVMDDE